VSVEHNVSHEVLDLLLLMVEWTKEAHAVRDWRITINSRSLLQWPVISYGFTGIKLFMTMSLLMLVLCRLTSIKSLLSIL
jgi:hypothetical protein